MLKLCCDECGAEMQEWWVKWTFPGSSISHCEQCEKEQLRQQRSEAECEWEYSYCGGGENCHCNSCYARRMVRDYEQRAKDDLSEELHADHSPPPDIGLKQLTAYNVEVRSLRGKSLVLPGTSTDKICHIKTVELLPGIMISFAIDAHAGVLYLHTSADLTW